MDLTLAESTALVGESLEAVVFDGPATVPVTPDPDEEPDEEV